jgi:parvulin-like peptidyl-prolyl isomerase
MFKTASILVPLLATVVLLPSVACDRNPSTSTTDRVAGTRSQPGKSTEVVLVTVNGTPIGEADVSFAMSRRGHDPEIPPEHRKNVLEVIIQQELIYQRAVELGLDANTGYQKKLRQMEAELNAFKRKELSELFWREIARRAVISEAEAKKYFEENAARIQTELHVWQILKRQEGLIQQALSDIEHGASLDEVARRQFPNLPEGAGQPWDLGYLKWKQVPEAWRNVVYDLKKSEVSGVIRGPNSRFWIIKLIDKRENPDITFESIKPTIMEVLKNEKIEGLRARAARDLRAKASIVYMQGSAEASEE